MDVLRTGNSVGGGDLFIPMKIAQWCMKPKKSFKEAVLEPLIFPWLCVCVGKSLEPRNCNYTD